MGKTKMCGALFGLVTALNAFGVFHLAPDQLQAVQALLCSGIVWGFRDAIAKGPDA